jgi:hypothetical protein
MNLNIHVVVIWDSTLHTDVVGRQRFGRLYCLHLQGELYTARNTMQQNEQLYL